MNLHLHQRHFPKWQLPKCAISQAANSLRLGLALWGAAGCNGGWALRLGQTWEVAVWKIAQLGSCHLGNTPGKLQLGGNSYESTYNIKRYTWINIKRKSSCGLLFIIKLFMSKIPQIFRIIFFFIFKIIVLEFRRLILKHNFGGLKNMFGSVLI